MCVVRSRRRHRGGHWQGQEEIPAKNGVCVCDWEKSGAGAHRNRIRSVWRQGLSHSTAWPASSKFKVATRRLTLSDSPSQSVDQIYPRITLFRHKLRYK